jgi:hypothetical protein
MLRIKDLNLVVFGLKCMFDFNLNYFLRLGLNYYFH